MKRERKKNVWKWILVIIAGAIAAVLAYGALKPAVPGNYEAGDTGGDLEQKYLAHGSREVSYTEQKALQDYEKYEIWYPSDLEGSEEDYPVIVVANGTGVKASKAKAMFEHYASWGFIVIGNEEAYSWNGFASDMSLSYLLKQNENPDSVFYQHVDPDHIGSLGHSQGGIGAINAVLQGKKGSLYKAAAAESPTSQTLADSLEWHYEPSELTVPIFYVCSDGQTDQNLVIPEADFDQLYEDTEKAPAAVKAIRTGEDHSNMLYCSDGYVTAWFLYYLQNDEEAGSVFFGEDPELARNPLYTDVSIRK